MEKRVPSFQLTTVQAEFGSPDSLRMTVSAKLSVSLLGFSDQDVVDVIQSLTRGNFYKSMTSYADHKVWQDVYHGSYKGHALYIKFTRDPRGHFILSFKER